MFNMHIGIDLGGTRIKVVAINSSGEVLEQSYTPTEDGDDHRWKQSVSTAVNGLLQKTGSSRAVVGISAPGLPNSSNKCIAFMPGRMQGLENFNWSAHLNQPAYVLNDAVAALMAEAKFGACKDVRHAVMLTLGTGVGGAILIDGKPYQGAFSKAGHIGHMVIDHAGDTDVTGMPGSLEECIGNCTIEKRSAGRFSSTRDLLDAAAAGDTGAREIWLKSVRQLAIGLASITNILSPEVIVLGGGIAEAGDALFQPLSKFMDQYEWRAGGNATHIVKAKYGDLAGAIGAASFALSKQENES
jgi:glucokinase